MSSLRVGLARLSSSADEAEILALVDGLDPSGYPELEHFPNRALVNAHDPSSGPLAPRSGLAERYEHLRLDKVQAKADSQAQRDLARARNQLLRSRWVTLGQTLGTCRQLSSGRGKGAVEKLANLNSECENSRWMKLGRKLGFYRG